MPGRVILTCSAAFLFLTGGAALFAPDELARALDPAAPRMLQLTIQLLGGGLLGFALIDWMSRRNRIGGIYARPLGIGNLLLFATAALTLGKAATVAPLPAAMIGICAVCAMLAASFAWLIFAHDPVAVTPPQTAT